MLATGRTLALLLPVTIGLFAQPDEQSAVLAAIQRLVPQLSDGKPEAARQVLPELPALLERARRLDNPSYAGVLETAYGRAENILGRNSEASAHYSAALALFLKTPRAKGVDASVRMLAGAFEDVDDSAHAIEAWADLLRIQKQSGDRDGLPSTYSHLIDLEDQADQIDLAIQYAREAEPFLDCASCARSRSSLLNRLGELLTADRRFDEAMQAFSEALRIRRELNDPALTAETLIAMANTSNASLHYPEALRSAREAQQSAAGDHALEGQAIREIARAQLGLGDRSAALDATDRAVKALEAANRPREIVYTLNTVAQGLLATEHSADTQRLLEKSAAIASTLPDQYGYAGVLLDLAYLRDYASDRAGAKAGFLQTREVAARHGVTWAEVRAILGLSSVARDEGDWKRAEVLLEEARTKAANAGAEDRLRVVNAQAVFFFYTSARQRALLTLDEMLRLSRSERIPRYEGIALHNLGAVYAELGELETSARYYEDALAIRRKLPDRFDLADTLNNLAARHLETGRFDDAAKDFSEARGIYQALADDQRASGALANYAAALERLNRKQEALSAYREALSAEERVADLRGVHSTLNNIALILVEQHAYNEAEDTLRRALRVANDARDDALALQTQANLGMFLRDLGRLDESRSLLASVLDRADGFRVDLASGDLRASWFATTQDYYSAYIQVLMRLHQKDPSKHLDIQAFEASERARARSLLETVERPVTGAEAGQREAQLRIELDAASSELFRTGNSSAATAKALNERIDQLSHELQNVQSEARLSGGKISVFQSQPLDWPQIRTLLDSRTTLLEFSIQGDEAWLWVGTNKDLHSFVLGPSADLNKKASLFFRAASSSTGRTRGAEPNRPAEVDWREAGATLSVALLKQALPALSTERLLIVADGVLARVPFAALPLPDDPTQPLIARYEILNAPSASVLAALRNRPRDPRTPSRTIAIFADPVFSASDTRVAGQPASTLLQREWSDSRIVRGISTRDGAIERLPYTQTEARRIATLVPESQLMLATDFAAGRDEILHADLANYRYLHFATHGYVDNEHPEVSALVLSMVDRNGMPVDGLLRLQDISRLHTPADLVVLSACQSGVGKEVGGEGLMGLLRGFFSAGARQVMATLWSVNDEATSELISRFYEHLLKDKMSPSSALREAQRKMWNSPAHPEWRTPFYWAAFTIQGDLK